MILRPATPEDGPALARLGRDSFVEKFGHLYAPQDLQAFLEQVYSPAAVQAEIENPGIVHCLAGEEGSGALIGYCKLRLTSHYAELSAAERPVELGQLYTAAGRTGQGIGAALMRWALDEARGRGGDAIQLSVWSENFGAQRFYQRYGFRHVADVDFWVGGHRDHEFLYELAL